VPPYSVLRADIVIPSVATIVNAATFQPGPVAPQHNWVTAFGSGFASQTIAASSQPLPATLGDTAISITDSKGVVSAAPLNYVSPGQANFLIPSGVRHGSRIRESDAKRRNGAHGLNHCSGGCTRLFSGERNTARVWLRRRARTGNGVRRGHAAERLCVPDRSAAQLSLDAAQPGSTAARVSIPVRHGNSRRGNSSGVHRGSAGAGAIHRCAGVNTRASTR